MSFASLLMGTLVALLTIQFELGTTWVSRALLLTAVVVFPWAMERQIVRLAARSKGPVTSVWVVDLDARDARASERFRDETSDNPTVR
ncbi:MAG: hypothetical protein H6838_15180 [Planctomycetes bacterium]|nr:hypothetical protein [Planctomycetota bacterium]